MINYIKHKLYRSFANYVTYHFEPRMVDNFQGVRDSRGSNTVSFNHKERVKLGPNTYIGHYTHLDGSGGLEIEEGVQIGECVCIFTHSSHIAIRIYGRHYTQVPEDQKKAYLITPCKIGAYSFIGSQAIILPGAKSIGVGCFIHPGAKIKNQIPDFSIVGNDGKIIGDTRDMDKKYVSADETLRQWSEEWKRFKSESYPIKKSPLDCLFPNNYPVL